MSSQLVLKLFNGVIKKDRSSIARSITLFESTLHSDKLKAEQLMNHLLTYTKKERISALRIGISGPPGAGKSSLIETLGLHLISRNHSVGVLAVDPSSTITGGSILGDKVRMIKLSAEENSFVRPSPSRGTLGGVARGTQAAIRVLEAARFDRILVETVGVGQSEVVVDQMVDLFLLLLSPAGGDELQGIKKGVVELADIIAVTKCDGELTNAAKNTKREYANAITLFHKKSPFWDPRVITCSSVSGVGVDSLSDLFEEFKSEMEGNGSLQNKRKEQSMQWMWRLIEEELMSRLKSNNNVNKILPDIANDIENERIQPATAADIILSYFELKDNTLPPKPVS